MSTRNISITDAGGAISVSFNGNELLLNKPQIGIIEIIKDDTLRIEMSGMASNIFIKASDVASPVVASAVDLGIVLKGMLVATGSANGDGNGDCACATLIQQTNTGIDNLTATVAIGNNQADTTNDLLTGIHSNVSLLNQSVTDTNTASLQKLDQVLSETMNVRSNTWDSIIRLDDMAQSSAGTYNTIQATNQILADNHTAVMQNMAALKSELVNVKTNVGTGNDQLVLVNQANASIISNGTTGNQYLSSLDGKVGNNGFLGNLSRKLKTITVQPAISTTAYAAGQVIGGIMTLTGALRTAVLSGTWMGVQVVEKSTQKAPMDIVLFTQNPTPANFTDHATAVWTNDYANIIAINNIVAANYSTLATSCGVCMGNLNKRVISATGNLYAVAICNGTPTYASASHLYFTFYFEQD